MDISLYVIPDPSLLKVLVERTGEINTYWNFYVGVSTAIIGILASGKIKNSKTIRIVFTLAFLAFAFSNLRGIIRLNEQREVLSTLIDIYYYPLVQTLKPTPFWVLINIFFHLLLDFLVVVGIWKIERNESHGNVKEGN